MKLRFIYIVHKNVVSAQQKSRYGDSWCLLLKEVTGVYSVNPTQQQAKHKWEKCVLKCYVQ